MNINPFINLIGNIISLYTTAFVIWMILFWLIRFRIINEYQSFVSQIMQFLNRVFEPTLNQIRKFVPPIGGIDLSPLVLFVLLNFTKDFLYTYFYQF